MIKKTVNFSEFCDSFSEERKDTFTYEGKRALFDYLEQYSEDSEEDVELDIIALCCEYTEYENLEEYNGQYNYNGQHAESIEDIEEKTTVIRIKDSEAFIIANY